MEDDKRLFIYQAVNFTHDFEDAPSKLDTEILFIFFSLIVFAGGIVYFIGSFFLGSKVCIPFCFVLIVIHFVCNLNRKDEVLIAHLFLLNLSKFRRSGLCI